MVSNKCTLPAGKHKDISVVSAVPVLLLFNTQATQTVECQAAAAWVNI